jgi:tetratricopeptide (TPR) repeat protein
LADSCSILGSDVLPANVARTKAHAAASKALELEPTIAEGHAELGLVEFYYDWDWPRSEREFRRAIELNPNYATAHQWYSYFLTAMGRFPEAVEEARKAQQIDPLSLAINATLAGRYRDAGQYDQAINIGQRTLEMDPNFVTAHSVLGATYEALGNWAQAILEYQKAAELSQGNPASLAALGCAYGYSGNREAARNVLARLREASRSHYVSAFDMAAVFASMGEKDNSFHWLEKAYSERESQMAFLAITRRLNGIHSDPRYSNMLHRMHLSIPNAPS